MNGTGNQNLFLKKHNPLCQNIKNATIQILYSIQTPQHLPEHLFCTQRDYRTQKRTSQTSL
jgi:hypothetical protein